MSETVEVAVVVRGVNARVSYFANRHCRVRIVGEWPAGERYDAVVVVGEAFSGSESRLPSAARRGRRHEGKPAGRPG